MTLSIFRIDLPRDQVEVLNEILERALGLCDDPETHAIYQELADMIDHQLIVQQELKADN